MADTDVTVLIATRDRCDHLPVTLDLIFEAAARSRHDTEVVVVDNGSSDATPGLLEARCGPESPLRVITDPVPGKSGAVNRALAHLRGKAVIFTDDDVHVPSSWVDDMAGPILTGTADAVCGRVVLAEHLARPWLTPKLRIMLAEMLDVSGGQPGMVGANMAASKQAAVDIGFDENLGPGARGFADDVMFNLRLKSAGYRLVGSAGPAAEHHLSADRLNYEAMRRLAENNGLSHAYLWHHWFGTDLRLVPVRRARAWARLTLAQVRRRGGPADMTDEAYEQHYALSFFKGLERERDVPRIYRS